MAKTSRCSCLQQSRVVRVDDVSRPKGGELWGWGGGGGGGDGSSSSAVDVWHPDQLFPV